MTAVESSVFSSLLRDTQYQFDRKLGSGANGVVVLGHLAAQLDGPFGANHRAIKVFSEKCNRYYAREKLAMETLKGCRNVIQIDKSVTTLQQCYIVMEECDGDLADFVSDSKRITEEDAKVCFRQMATGLFEAHSRRICHHDVKLDNFLIGKDGQIRLADFGYSVSMNDQNWTQTTPAGDTCIIGKYSSGSPAYSSYQVLMRSPHSPVLNDIYGLGICLYRLLCGRFPFCDPKKDNKETLKRNVEASVDQSNIYFPSYVSLDARELICGTIAVNEEDRWGWEEIRQHRWVK
eukprot:TRINITY_DN2350_c0_g1_i4.p1 TRINITY_DN2350_c0_g1~~TRINITY_DN2350_c0_g1_i4.p1  ORF type:complete len:291 (-),score=109.74 TRINITY_DN2350_c0_g1_i4:72-944(-)